VAKPGSYPRKRRTSCDYTTPSISRLRGKFLEYRGIPVMCTFHPSYLLRSPEKKKEVWEDMKKLLVRMGRTVPGKSG
jgi:DNA polymerase